MPGRVVFTGILLLCLVWGAAQPATAQEARGTILGRVTDAQAGVIPGASVIIINLATNTLNRVTTNDTGYYEVPLLVAGRYTITAEATGFKKSVRGPLELNVGTRVEINLQLEVGNVAETVTVTAEAPLLETTSASGGRVIDNRQIMELPFSDMNPFALTGLAAGMQWTGQPEYRRPFDNAGTSSFNTAGGVGQNEYSLDGAPVTGTGRRVGFVPPSDAVQEFKMETANFDAAFGHTSGATVNVMTKSGTNDFHGSLYEQHWQQRWNATPHFTRLQWENAVRQGKISKDSQKQGTGRSNQFGGTLGGPVRIPKLYNGRDKSFFFFSYNGIYQKKAETTAAVNRNVPKMNWRQGDFSDLLAIDPDKYQIYDPRTARLSGNRVIRDPFPGNRGIPVLNPLYKFYEKLYPAPNDVPGLVSPEGFNNYLATQMPKDERFNSLLNRFDYNFNEKHKVFGRWYWNHRLADEYDWTYETARGLHSNGLTRINKGAGADYVWTISGRTVLNLTVAFQRFNEGSVRPNQIKFKPTDVGLPAYLDAKAGDFHSLPRLDFDSIEDVADSYPAIGTRGSTGEAKATLMRVSGNHSLKFGWDERRYWRTSAGPGNSSGLFSFRNTYMRKDDADTRASNHGLEWAAFMMGATNGMSIDTNDSAFWSTPWRAFFAQDDWRLTNRLRLNLGLRYEWEQGTTERFNRAVAGGFDFNARLPLSDAVEAAYARIAIPEMTASQFKVQGGGFYMGQGGPRSWTDGTHHLLPRIGLVYQISPRTVIRAGYGWYYDTFNVNNDTPSQFGFNQGTGTTISTDNGLTFCCGADFRAGRTPLHDPFPVRADGIRFNTPLGNSLGAVAVAGRGFNANSVGGLTFVPRHYSPAGQQRWRFSIQHQFTNNVVLDVSYNGAYSRIPVGQRIDFLPPQYWATGNVRNQAVDDDLNRNIPNNPFHFSNFPSLANTNPTLYNYLRTVGLFNSSNIRKNQLLRNYRHISGFYGLRPGLDFADSRGGVEYHDLEIQLEKRFSRGFTTSVLYTYASSETQDWYANEFDTRPGWRINNNTRPHRFVSTGIWELPFGKDRSFLTGGPLKHIAGGWRIGWIYQRNSGPAPDWGNRFFYGDLDKIEELFQHDRVHSKDIHWWFDSSIAYKSTGPIPQGFTGFEGRTANQPGAYHVRVFPSRLSALRSDGIRNWDVNVNRDFRITEAFKARFGVDLLNATNHTNFSGPNLDPTNSNFGKVTSQRGLSRVIQFNLRLQF